MTGEVKGDITEVDGDRWADYDDGDRRVDDDGAVAGHASVIVAGEPKMGASVGAWTRQ